MMHFRRSKWRDECPDTGDVETFADGKIDFGIISTPVNNKYDFKMTPVRKIQDVFVAGKKFEYLKGGKLSYKSLKIFRWCA